MEQRSALALALCLGCGLVAANSRADDPPQQSAPRVTTDSREYCDHLAQHAAVLRGALAAPPGEALELAAQGEQMCERGWVRPGIARLRRAIVLMREAGATARRPN